MWGVSGKNSGSGELERKKQLRISVLRKHKTRRRLARERKRCFSSSSEDGSRKRESVNSWWILYELWRGKLWNYTETLLHTNTFTDAFTHRDFYTQRLLHTDTFTRRRFYTQALLHVLVHTNTFTDAFTHRDFYTQRLLHTDTFTRRRFYTQALLHADAFTHRSFYTQTLLHTNAFAHRPFYTQTLLHTEAFTHRRFYTQMLLHTHTFIHRGFYTQKLLKSVSIWHFMVLNSNCSVFDIKHMMASSSVANVCRHFTSEVLSHVSFTASWYRSFLGQVCGIFHNNMK